MSGELSYSQRFQIGRVIGRTFTGVGQNFGLLVLFSLVFVCLPNVIGAYVIQSLGIVSPLERYLCQAASSLPAVIFISASLWGVTRRFAGKSAPLTGWLEAGFRNAISLFGLRWLTNLGIGVGLVLLIVPGLIWMTSWAVAGPIMVAEKETISGAIERSSRLTRGHRWAILALTILLLAAFLLSSLVVGVFVGLASALMTALLHVSWTVDQLSNFAAGPLLTAGLEIFLVVGASAIYFELPGNQKGTADATAAVFE
jgi:hypothetical protein